MWWVGSLFLRVRWTGRAPQSESASLPLNLPEPWLSACGCGVYNTNTHTQETGVVESFAMCDAQKEISHILIMWFVCVCICMHSNACTQLFAVTEELYRGQERRLLWRVKQVAYNQGTDFKSRYIAGRYKK